MVLYNGKGELVPEVLSIAGMTVATIGDSFTSPGTWQSVAAERTGCVISNVAQGGARYSYNPDAVGRSAYEQAATLSGNVDMVLITMGVNDLNNRIPLGEFTPTNDYMSVDTSTVAGGLQKAIGHIQNTYPDAIIKVGWTPSGGCFLGPEDDVDGMTAVIQGVCSRMGVKYIDTLTCGITKYTNAHLGCFQDGADGGHPTPEGYRVIGEYMARKIIADW